MAQSKRAGARLAVDIGGTFTDVVLHAGRAEWTTKVLTTISKHCTLSIVTDADPAGLGLSACPGLGTSCAGAVASVGDEATCMSCTHRLTADCLFAATLGKTSPGCQ